MGKDEMWVRKQYQIEIINGCAPLVNLSDDEDINRAWENIEQNIRTSSKDSLGLQELKQQKPCFDEECLGFIDQRKPAKMQWIQNQGNVVNLNNVRRDASRHFRKKKRSHI